MGEIILNLLNRDCFIHITRMEDDTIGLVVGRHGTISTRMISPNEIDINIRYSADNIICEYLKQMSEELLCGGQNTKDVKPVKERFDLDEYDDEEEAYDP